MTDTIVLVLVAIGLVTGITAATYLALHQSAQAVAHAADAIAKQAQEFAMPPPQIMVTITWPPELVALFAFQTVVLVIIALAGLVDVRKISRLTHLIESRRSTKRV